MPDKNADSPQNNELKEALELLNALLFSGRLPSEPKLLENNADFAIIYNHLLQLRKAVSAFSRGDFSHKVEINGVMGTSLKNFQTSLNHLARQAEIIAGGDFSQRVEFMGRFASAFNSMAARLHRSLDDLRCKEKLFSSFTESLKQEIAVRIQAEETLRLSEERYKMLAAIDPLTGLYNRRYFFHLAISEFSRIKRSKGIISMGMMDVDFFKNFNDLYGHLNGDICLQHISRLSEASLRQTDVIGRYGGEEFIFLLPETGYASGMLVADRLRAALADTPVRLQDGRKVSITVSIGLTFVHGDTIGNELEKSLLKSIEAADNAMYKAKKEGRNRVVSNQELSES